MTDVIQRCLGKETENAYEQYQWITFFYYPPFFTRLSCVFIVGALIGAKPVIPDGVGFMAFCSVIA